MSLPCLLRRLVSSLVPELGIAHHRVQALPVSLQPLLLLPHPLLSHPHLVLRVYKYE